MPFYLEQITSVLNGEDLHLANLSVDEYVYLRGHDTLNGSTRMYSPSDGTIIFEARVSGSWIIIGIFSPP